MFMVAPGVLPMKDDGKREDAVMCVWWKSIEGEVAK